MIIKSQGVGGHRVFVGIRHPFATFSMRRVFGIPRVAFRGKSPTFPSGAPCAFVLLAHFDDKQGISIRNQLE